MNSQPLKLLILGFGNVGQRLAEILADRSTYPGLDALDSRIVGVVTGRHGSLLEPDGIDPAALVTSYRDNGQVGPSGVTSPDAIRDSEFDVLLELTTLQVDSEGEPAAEHCRLALRKRAHVVTANKGPLAFHASELLRLAEAVGRQLLFESTVMDGAPVFSLFREGLRGCTIVGFEAILNSTSNFVLSYLEAGRSVDEGVLGAQKLGIAEADPHLDLAGWDSAVKVCVLANTLMQGDLRPGDVERKGIESVTPELVANARETGGCIKLVCEAWRDAARVRGRVGPRILSLDHTLAHTGALGGALLFRSDLMTPILVQQEDPTPTDTAYGVINDLLTIQARWHRS